MGGSPLLFIYFNNQILSLLRTQDLNYRPSQFATQSPWVKTLVYLCRSPHTRGIHTGGQSLLANRIDHPGEAAEPVGGPSVAVDQPSPVFHAISVCQVDVPRRAASPSGRGEFPMGSEVHPAERAVPPQQVPRRKLAEIEGRRRRLSLPQRHAARRAQRQPRLGGATPPREAQREVHHAQVLGPLRHQDGQGLHSRGHHRVRQAAAQEDPGSRGSQPTHGDRSALLQTHHY